MPCTIVTPAVTLHDTFCHPYITFIHCTMLRVSLHHDCGAKSSLTPPLRCHRCLTLRLGIAFVSHNASTWTRTGRSRQTKEEDRQGSHLSDTAIGIMVVARVHSLWLQLQLQLHMNIVQCI